MKPVARVEPFLVRPVAEQRAAQPGPAAAALTGASNVPPSTAPDVPPDDTAQRLRDRAPIGAVGERRVCKAIAHALLPLGLTLRILFENGTQPSGDVRNYLEVFRSDRGHYFPSAPPGPGPWPYSGFASRMDSLLDAVLERITLRETRIGVPGEFVRMLRWEAGTEGTDLEIFRFVVARMLEEDIGHASEIRPMQRNPLPAPAPTPAAEPAPAPSAPAPSPTPPPASLDTLARVSGLDAVPDKRAPLTARSAAAQVIAGRWDTPLFDVIPHVTPDVPGWNPGRQLEIHDPTGPLSFNGPADPGKPPVQLYLQHQHYSPIVDGERRYVPSDGNCFFEAAIHAMGADDAAAFGANYQAQWRGLRDAVARYVATHWDAIAPFIEVEPSVRRRYVYARTAT